jgi:DNA-binding CsgD family transcriptional regulator
MDLLYIIIINISLGGILFSIFFTSSLNKKYRLPFLSSYLYFQVFLAVFGAYGILVPAIIRKVLVNQDILMMDIENICHFFTFLGVPFFLLSCYMFLRACYELVESKLPTCNILAYLITWFLFFAGYGIMIYFFKSFSYKYFPLIPQLIRAIIGGFGFIILFQGTLILILKSAGWSNTIRKRLVFWFGMASVIIYSCVIVSVFLVNKHQVMGALFLFLFFTSGVIPLMIIRSLLVHTIPVPESKLDHVRNLKQFYKEFGISKREEEIIQLICAGESNKEISDKLFITLQTVKDHVHRIFLKTGVKNRIQLSNLIQKLKPEK